MLFFFTPLQHRITDFGQSKRTLTDATQKTTNAVGTRVYTAPEVSSGEYSFAMDVYSFGIMCMEIWNQRYPFTLSEVEALADGRTRYCVCLHNFFHLLCYKLMSLFLIDTFSR